MQNALMTVFKYIVFFILQTGDRQIVHLSTRTTTVRGHLDNSYFLIIQKFIYTSPIIYRP